MYKLHPHAILKTEFARINLVLIGFAFLFLSGPLLALPHSYFSPADMLQGSPVFAVSTERIYPHNRVLGDDIYTYLPWLEFSWRSLRRGEIPLWNPYNGAGRPLLANMQSSIFFPSQWPGFFFGERVGLLARCFLHLYLSGFFAFYFFRSLKLWFWAALVGAVSFMFGGMMVVWLYNELSATFLLFPLLLLVLERHLSRVTSALLFAGELSLAIMLQIFGGHPETIFLSVALATIYLCYRLLTDPVSWPGWVPRLKILGLYVAGGLWGLVLGAIQLFPFIEYLLNSAALATRSTIKSPNALAPPYLLTYIFPNPFGNPTFGSKLDFTQPNYSEVSGGYIGLTVLFLALCALWVARKNPLTWLMWAIILVIIPVVFDVGPLHQLTSQLLPGFVLFNRLTGYAGFFLITLMVFTLDGLGKNPNLAKLKFKSLAGTVAVAGILFLAGAGGLFWWFSGARLVPFEQAKVSNFEVRDFLVMSGLFIVSLGGLVLFLAVKVPLVRQIDIVAVLLAIFGQLSFSGQNYRSPVPDAYFYPNTPITVALQQSGGRTAPAGTPGLLPPEANIWYSLEQVNGYDSLEVRWYDELLKASETRWPDWNNPGALNLFNIKQVLAGSADPNFQAGIAPCCPQLRRTSKYTGINLYTNQAYQPSYRLVYHSLSEPDQLGLQNLLDGKINPLNTVLFPEGAAPPALLNSDDPANFPTVEVFSKTANHSRLHVNNPQSGYLYIDQTYFPGWEAKVNGQPAELYRANVAFTALEVGAGDLAIELNYNPLSFRLGLLLTVLGLMLTSLVGHLKVLQKRYKKLKPGEYNSI